jgi:hypothetical protein
MHVGYINSLAACPPAISAAITANGGFEGNSGFPDYTTKFNAVINLAGALNETSFVGPGSIPSCNAQGTDDNVVPYYCGNPLGGLVAVNLCGLGALEPVYDSNGVYHMSHVFPGQGHVPWATYPAMFTTVDSMIKVFLFDFVCLGVANVTGAEANADISLFPNPASESINITSSVALGNITVYDQTGRTVFNANGINKEIYEINTSHCGKGVYFVKISFSNDSVAPVVKQVVIE